MKFTKFLLTEKNIINISELDSYLDELASGKPENVQKWIKSNLKMYIVNKYDGLDDVKQWHPSLGKKPIWFDKAMERHDRLYSFRGLDRNFLSKLNHVFDYFREYDKKDLSRFSIEDAISNSEKWTKQLIKKSGEIEDETGIRTEKTFDDGFKIVEVVSNVSLNREGKLMNHCAGSYANQVASGRTKIFSLRDPNNKPHCTIEVRNNKIQQIKRQFQFNSK